MGLPRMGAPLAGFGYSVNSQAHSGRDAPNLAPVRRHLVGGGIEPARRRGSGNARRPEHRPRRDPFAAGDHPVAVHGGDGRVELDLDMQPLQRGEGVGGKPRPEPGG